ncbi:hypothetical protein MMC22_008997 [Lobaria immixta]|nr:hypothetical protein [Lobaria immixta]
MSDIAQLFFSLDREPSASTQPRSSAPAPLRASYRSRRFGSIWGTFLFLVPIVNTDALQPNHWDINTWADPEVLGWKASHLASCNAIAVAGAIFASIGLSALQLPSMNAVHWSARACCSSSMVFGVASVFTAARQHQTVGMLNSPLDIRLWLSRRSPSHFKNILRPFNDTTRENTDKYARFRGFQGLPLESSISALKAAALPRYFLNVAVPLFLVGFGLYVLFLWLSNIEESGESYRNVFIVFIVTVGTYAIYDFLVELTRILDDDKRNKEFNTNALGGYRELEKLRGLQNKLAEVQQRMKSEHLFEQELQEIQFQRQQDLEDVVETERPTFANTNAQLVPTGDRNFSLPVRAPSIALATAKLPGATRDHPSPASPTNRNASPACKVEKYQAWHHYLIGYMKTQAVSEDNSLLLKIMERERSIRPPRKPALPLLRPIELHPIPFRIQIRG